MGPITAACALALLLPASIVVRIVVMVALIAAVYLIWWQRSLRHAHPILELRWERAERRAGRPLSATTHHRFKDAWEEAGGDPNPFREQWEGAADPRSGAGRR